MGLHGTWLAATELEAKALFRVEESATAFNPFKRVAVTARALRVDVARLNGIRTVSEKWLLDDAVAALVTATADDFVRVHPDIPEPIVLRISERATRALGELPADTTLVTEEAIARLMNHGKRLVSLSPELALGLRAIAQDAIRRGGAVYGILA